VRGIGEMLARAARDAAVPDVSSEKRAAAVQVMQGIGPREDRIVDDINKYCGN